MAVTERPGVLAAQTTAKRVQRRWSRSYAARLLLTDALVVAGAVLVALRVRFGATGPEVVAGANPAQGLTLTTQYTTFSVVLFLGWMLALQAMSTRSPRVLGQGADEYKRVATATFRVFSVVAIAAYLVRADVARGYIAIAFPVGCVGLLVGRWLWRKWLIRQWEHGRYQSPVVLVGDLIHVLPTYMRLGGHTSSGFRVVGVCVPAREAPAFHGLVEVLGDPEDAAVIAMAHRVDALIIASTASGGPELVKRTAWAIEGADIDLILGTSLTDVAGPRIHSRPVAGLPLIHVEEPRFEGGARIVKNLFERSVALAGVALLSPAFVLLAVLVARSGPGPIFYKQTRVGLRGKPFSIYKFRSMVNGADAKLAELSNLDEGSGALFKIRSDPRVTPIGRYLRRWSLDELPQLFNVLNGSMALVGPRPPLPHEVEKYAQHVHRRLLVKPGITGLWQVSGRSDLSWEDSVRLDLSYVENWTLMDDLIILWRTARAVTAGSGAY